MPKPKIKVNYAAYDYVNYVKVSVDVIVDGGTITGRYNLAHFIEEEKILKAAKKERRDAGYVWAEFDTIFLANVTFENAELFCELPPFSDTRVHDYLHAYVSRLVLNDCTIRGLKASPTSEIHTTTVDRRHGRPLPFFRDFDYDSFPGFFVDGFHAYIIKADDMNEIWKV